MNRDPKPHPPTDHPPAASDLHLLQRRIRVARGLEPADLLLTGGQVVNVFTQRVEPAEIVVADGWIAGVGPQLGPAHHTIALAGRAVLPGLIDPHMHLESTLLTPAELARLIVPHGTTTIISDSHEVGNVLGVFGLDLLLSASRGLPLDLFFMAPACVPATTGEDAGAVLGPPEVRALLTRPRVLGLAEVMDVPAVLAGDPGILEKLRAALDRDRVVDGHAPALAGRDLMAYAAVGIRSDHEATTAEEGRARAALGLLVQVREGSIARNLDAILPALAAGELGDNWCLVTDDIFADELRHQGHLDGLLRRVVAGGVPPACAVRHATLVPARHYGLTDRGAVAPGYRADLVVVEDLRPSAPTWSSRPGRSWPAMGSIWPRARRRGSTPRTRSAWPPSMSRRSGSPWARRPAPSSGSSPIKSSPAERRSRFVEWMAAGRSTAPGSRPDRQPRAAPGDRADRPGAGRRSRRAGRSPGLVGGPRFAQPDRRRRRGAGHAGLHPVAGRERGRVRSRLGGGGPRPAASAVRRAALARRSRRRLRPT